MPLNWKARFSILALVLGVAIGGFVTNQIQILTGNTQSSLNFLDAFFFQENNNAKYIYRENAGAITSNLTIRGQVLDSTHTNVTITIAGVLQGNFTAHPNGTVYEKGITNGNYSIWWVYVSNVMMMLGVNEGHVYNVIDPTGFLGVIGKDYKMTVTRKRVLWPSDPSQKYLLGAQASFDVSIADEVTEEIAATAIFDITCGVLEEFSGTIGGGSAIQTLSIVETTFPISRNRLTMITAVSILGPLVILFAFLFMKIRWTKSPLSRLNQPTTKRSEILLLLGTGILMVLMEIIDIWFYLVLDRTGNLFLHIGFIAWVAYVCHRQKYGYRWTIPAFLEIAFVFTIGFFTGEPYVPALTANLGSMVTWVGLLWASGVERYVDEAERNLLSSVI